MKKILLFFITEPIINIVMVELIIKKKMKFQILIEEETKYIGLNEISKNEKNNV